jgi:hypothetical protein
MIKAYSRLRPRPVGAVELPMGVDGRVGRLGMLALTRGKSASTHVEPAVVSMVTV